MDFIQETDSRIIFTPPQARRSKVPVSPVYQTSGGKPSLQYYPLLNIPNLIRTALDVTHQTENRDIANEGKKVLLLIQEMVNSFKELKLDLGYLSPLNAYNVDDGSLLIEWVFRDFRIGFSYEPNPNESGWYLITNRTLGEISASGYLSNDNYESLILWLLNFALSNS